MNLPGRTVRLGLTGGVGSGKSTVASLLRKQGARVVDADAISRSTTSAGGCAITAIANQFGAHFIAADGALDRVQMRKHIFSDPTAKSQLEGIVHPLVAQEIELQVQAAQATDARCIVYDIPLLVESPRWRKQLDRVLVVDCSHTTQIARVVARSGLSSAEIRTMIAAQATREHRLAAADLVLFNEGLTLETLALQVRQIGQLFGL